MAELGPENLKSCLRQAAGRYAENNGLQVDRSRATALIFNRLEDGFCPGSWARIQARPDWYARTQKRHTQVRGALEMQSSNSSDALLMNIFCYPDIGKWKGVADLLGVRPEDPEFGFKARVAKDGTDGDETEIDMAIGDCFVEAKLTEKDFCRKHACEVLKYTALENVFHVDMLSMCDEYFDDYQVIRNLLAAIQHGKRHLLICDERRSDLVLKYSRTVCCLRDRFDRARCGVVFWQDLARASGRPLRSFLEDRYGLE
jgi:hypothetical protein